MKKLILCVGCVISLATIVYSDNSGNWSKEQTSSPSQSGDAYSTGIAERNMMRAMEIVDTAMAHYFTGEDLVMARFYNPYTNTRSDEKGSVWMYTSAIEAVVAIMNGLEAHRSLGDAKLHEDHFGRYATLLGRLYDNLAYYQGTFELKSFTQTREWSVYGVHRANAKGTARVEGIENVYDDQQWLVRELLEAYKLTGESRYLTEAEYLTDYVLDGWDRTLDANGNEHGGIPWGPGYVTKHACSNGPMVSPLVWLHLLYKESNEQVTYGYIGADKKRQTASMSKGDYYLQFAEAVYAWQKDQLLREDGVYYDMRGGCGNCRVAYENVDGATYRAHTPLPNAVGRAYSYNAGTMLSGAADLYRATGNGVYLDELKSHSNDSFSYFAKLGADVQGYYSYDVDGFNNWFNGVLMRGYADVYPVHGQVDTYLHTFQQNLDYGYQNHLYNGFLPSDLLQGWNNDNWNMEGMFSFAFAAEYALLAKYELEK